jgi:hypothetical protein
MKGNARVNQQYIRSRTSNFFEYKFSSGVAKARTLTRGPKRPTKNCLVENSKFQVTESELERAARN